MLRAAAAASAPAAAVFAAPAVAKAAPCAPKMPQPREGRRAKLLSCLAVETAVETVRGAKSNLEGAKAAVETQLDEAETARQGGRPTSRAMQPRRLGLPRERAR